MKLQLVYMSVVSIDPACSGSDFYELCTKEKHPKHIACIATDKAGAKLIRKLIQQKQRKSRKPKGMVYGIKIKKKRR